MALRLKKGKEQKNVPKMAQEEEIEFDIGALSLAEGYVDDPSEETVLMTKREMNVYIKQTMKEYYLKDPQLNSFIELEKQVKELLKEIEVKEQRLLKAQKDFKRMYKKQLKFFRHREIVPTKSVGVSADFPILPE